MQTETPLPLLVRRTLTAFAAGTVLALLGGEPLLAQQGPPSLPPGLHDRALPPGTPFEFGGFDPPGQREEQEASAWTHPGMAASNPHAFGASFGQLWAGSSYQPRARRSDGHTGAAAVGFGLGDPARHLGAQVSIYSFSTISSGFGNRSAMDVQLHRMLPADFALAVGWESALVWGPRDTRPDSGENRYAVVSRWFSLGDGPIFSSAMLSLGVGDGRFQSEADFFAGKKGVGLFGSAAVRVSPPVSVIAEWTGQDLLLATALTPLPNHRLGFTVGLTDVLGHAGDGARVVLGGSAAVEFLSGR